MSSYNAATDVWSSRVSSSHATFAGAPQLATDAANAAGNGVAVQYIAGSPATHVTFPEDWSEAAQMSSCTLSRYTGAARQSIFASPDGAWLSGAPPRRARTRAPRAARQR
jgi:hypothetical protein